MEINLKTPAFQAPNRSTAILRMSIGLLITFLCGTVMAMSPFAKNYHYKKDYQSFEEERELVIAAPGELVVDAGKNGGISVHGWDRPDVQIIAKVNVYCETENEAEVLFSKINVFAENKIYAEGPGSNWAVSFEIFAPKTLYANLEAFNGGISIETMASKVSMRTVNGGINVTHCAGEVRGKTTNGGLRIQCNGTSWQGNGIDLITTNGGVSISIPEEFNGELATGTVNGRMSFDFPVTVQGEIDRSFETVLGKGGPRIRAITTNGAVRLSN